jgi:hypothetical protein
MKMEGKLDHSEGEHGHLRGHSGHCEELSRLFRNQRNAYVLPLLIQEINEFKSKKINTIMKVSHWIRVVPVPYDLPT